MYFLNKSLIVVTLMACCSASWATSVESLQKHSLNSQASSKQSQLEINKIDDQLIQVRQQVKVQQGVIFNPNKPLSLSRLKNPPRLLFSVLDNAVFDTTGIFPS